MTREISAFAFASRLRHDEAIHEEGAVQIWKGIEVGYSSPFRPHSQRQAVAFLKAGPPPANGCAISGPKSF